MADAAKRRAPKAQVLQAFELVRYAIMTALIVVMIVSLVSLSVRNEADIRPGALAVYENVFIYAPGGIHPMDPVTGRSDPFTIDSAAFNDQTLAAMMQHANNRFAGGMFTLRDNVDGSTQYAYWDREIYDRYRPLASSRGTGRSVLRRTTHDVRIIKQGIMHPGNLTIELVVYQ